VLRHILRDPLGRIGLALVLLVALTALLSPWIAPYDPAAIAIRAKLQAPSLSHPFGTDQLGRDVFSRVVVGARIALETALAAVALAVIAGSALGLLAGQGPAWLDNLLMLVLDTLRSFPTVMFALMLVTLIGPSLVTVVAVVVASLTPGYG